MRRRHESQIDSIVMHVSNVYKYIVGVSYNSDINPRNYNAFQSQYSKFNMESMKTTYLPSKFSPPITTYTQCCVTFTKDKKNKPNAQRMQQTTTANINTYKNASPMTNGMQEMMWCIHGATARSIFTIALCTPSNYIAIFPNAT